MLSWWGEPFGVCVLGQSGILLRENRLARLLTTYYNTCVAIHQALVLAHLRYNRRASRLGADLTRLRVMRTQFRLVDELGDRMSQSELARQAGLAFATVNRLCTNSTAQVSLETLDKISAVLGCEPGDLIERKRKRK